MKIIASSLILFSSIVTPSWAADLVPLPASQQKIDGSFTLKAGAKVGWTGVGAEAEARKVASLLDAYFSAGTKSATVAGAGDVTLVLDASTRERLGDEGYALEVGAKGVRIIAADPRGLFYGGRTLKQLLPVSIDASGKAVTAGASATLEGVRIEDKPRFGWRGYMLDVSRHFTSADDVKRLIDEMADRKLNLLHWHLTDDEGWRIEIKALPKLTEVGAWRGPNEPLPVPGRDKDKPIAKIRYGGFYTQDQIRDVVRHAAERHIQILPEIDVPGHCLAFTVAYPETLPDVVADGESAQGFKGNVISPAKEENYRKLELIFKEVSELFPFPYIHIGGDEVNHGMWSKSPEVKAVMEKQGIRNVAGMQGYFNERLERIIKPMGRTLIGWNEILGKGKLSQDTAVMSWTGIGPGIDAARAGHPVVMIPGSQCYFDMAYPGPGEQGHWWAGKVGLPSVYNWDPVQPGQLDATQQKRVMGVQAALWCEFVPDYDRVQYMTWPRLSALAEVAWTPQEKRSYQDFIGRLFRGEIPRLQRSGVAFRVPPPEARYADGKVTLVVVPGARVRYTIDGSDPEKSKTAKAWTEGTIATRMPDAFRARATIGDRTSNITEGAERESLAKWSQKQLGDDWKPLSFDLTEAAAVGGVQYLVFRHTGAKPLLVRNAVLKADGKVVARLADEGKSGGGSKLRLRMSLGKVPAGTKLEVACEGKAESGRNSEGSLYLEPALGLEAPATVEASFGHHADNAASRIADWDRETFMWSNRNLRQGDQVTVAFEKAQTLRGVDWFTGKLNTNDDILSEADFMVSEDGVNFEKAGAITYGSVKVSFPVSRKVKAMRLVVKGATTGWVVIQDPILR